MDLLDPATGIPELVISRHAQARGLPFGRHAASLVYQRYCHRHGERAVVSLFNHGSLPRLDAVNVTAEFVDGSPTTLHVSTDRPLTNASVDDLADLVIDQHLLPMAQAWQAVSGVGLRNLWGNMAAGMARGVRLVSEYGNLQRARAFGEALAATRPELAALGTYRFVSDDTRQRLFYDRKTCCHWYAVPETGKFCTWCSRLSEKERTDRFRASIATG